MDNRMENRDISEGESETYGCILVGIRERVEGFVGRALYAGLEYLNRSQDTPILRENTTECEEVKEDFEPGSLVSDEVGAERLSDEDPLPSCVREGWTVHDLREHILRIAQENEKLKIIAQASQGIVAACQNVNLEKLKTDASILYIWFVYVREYPARIQSNVEMTMSSLADIGKYPLEKTGCLFNSVSQVINSVLNQMSGQPSNSQALVDSSNSPRPRNPFGAPKAEKVPEVVDEKQSDIKDGIIMVSGQDDKTAETEEGGRVGYPEGEKYPGMTDDELQEFEDCVTEISDEKLGAVPDELSTVEGRKGTFLNAIDELKTIADQLAVVGFFVIKGRTVKCFDCAAVHYNCEPVRDPTSNVWHREGCGIVRRRIQDRGRLAERSRDNGNHPRTRSLTVPHQISSAGREGDNLEGAVGYASRGRMRSSSVPPESDLPAKCKNCNQDPVQEAEKVELLRSVPVQRICYYCHEHDDVDICIRTRRHACRREECQRKSSSGKKATAEEE